MISPAKMAANQANARKSSGPKTEVGKQASRRNSTTHGMTGEGIVLAGEMAVEADRLDRALIQELRPLTQVGRAMVRKAAVMIQRFDISVRRERAAIANNVQASLDLFDETRLGEIDAAFARLADEPGEALDLLRRTPEGIERLIDAWSELDPTVESWGPEHWTRLDNLRGLPADLTPDRPTAGVREIIVSEIGRLCAAMQAIDFQAVALERRQVADLALFDPSPEACLARRYEAAADRMLHKALSAFKQAEGEPVASIGPVVTHDRTMASETVGSFIPAPRPVPEPTPEFEPIVPEPAVVESEAIVPDAADEVDPATKRLHERASRPDPRKLMVQMKRRR